MRNHSIAIQGSVASFHDIAAKKYFGQEVSTIECGSFREVCDKISQNKADYGVIAIENKVAGSILLNYHLIETYDLKIIGEIYLPIELQLLAKVGTKLNNIREIISHPMALGQSQVFLSQQEGVVVTEFKDTASCAKIVLESSLEGMAVIAGPTIAKAYNLEVIVENVCDVKENFTRFYIISKGEDYCLDSNKASITIQTDNTFGKLSDVLVVIKNMGLNLTKIQSVPIANNSNAYAFHLDIEFDNRELFEKTISDLKKQTKHLKVLGIYKTDRNNCNGINKVSTHNNLN